MGLEVIRKTTKGKHGAQTVVSRSGSPKGTPFLPHSIEDKLKTAGKNISKFVEEQKKLIKDLLY